ncbi:hypothetical protein MON38_00560 [Hymenobacter sp. DH14]|uniref:Uncharacterized protein n=1 Tax=Hymenobacter cyanobacteriorum TaxID=2926463 RepID=A0A9X1VC11_9BACT|nr:hypothetical protein [Hymenobacter cyanobacteriorum]
MEKTSPALAKAFPDLKKPCAGLGKPLRLHLKQQKAAPGALERLCGGGFSRLLK